MGCTTAVRGMLQMGPRECGVGHKWVGAAGTTCYGLGLLIGIACEKQQEKLQIVMTATTAGASWLLSTQVALPHPRSAATAGT